MKQSRRMSLCESVVNTVVGFSLGFLAMFVMSKLLDIPVSHQENALIGVVFTIISIARSFVLRRVFEHIRAISQ